MKKKSVQDSIWSSRPKIDLIFWFLEYESMNFTCDRFAAWRPSVSPVNQLAPVTTDACDTCHLDTCPVLGITVPLASQVIISGMRGGN